MNYQSKKKNHTYGSNYSHKTNNPNKKWYQRLLKYDLSLNVPAAIAAKRLEKAFASPVIISKNFLNLKINHLKYTGTVTGNHIDALFTFLNTGKGGSREYYAQGEIIDDLQGSRIKMIIEDRRALLDVFSVLIVSFFLSFLAQSIFLLFAALLFFGVFLFVAGGIINRSASNKIADILKNIVSDNITVTGNTPKTELKSLYKKGIKLFRHPLSFKGRIRRTEYAIGLIIHIFVAELINVLGHFFQFKTITFPSVSIFIILILLIWNSLAEITKRCHDCGRSGWWFLLPFYFFILLIQEGQRGPNKYGPDPKEVEIQTG